MEFVTELKKLGLNDKEAAVYMACLELGPRPVQQIARKAKVVRATTYVVLDSLLSMGLVTKFEQGKKTLFSAEPPRQLGRLLEKEQEAIQEKQHQLELMLPELHMLMRTTDAKPTVRYFEGKEGLHAIRQEIIMYCRSGDTIYNFTPTDYLTAIFPENEGGYFRQRVAKGIHSKTIFTTRSESLRAFWLSKEQLRLGERRYIPPEHFPSSSGMTIFRDRIAAGTFVGKIMGVIIESESMADMMKHFFDLAWKGAEKLS